MKEVLRRETWLATLGGVVLAIAMTWPLVLHLGSDIGKDLGDPLLQAWQVAWIGHALLEHPLDLWQANTDQLTAAGVRPDAVVNARLCTACHRDLFFSYRKEGPGLRLATLALLE